MPKFMCVCDPHFRFGFPSPISRKDDYNTVINEKIDQIVKIGVEHGVVAVLVAGDVTDKKYPSSYSLSSISGNMALMQKLGSEVEHGVLTIPGNHDLPWSNYAEMDRSFYGLMSQVNMITDLSFSKTRIGDTVIYGVPFLSDSKQLFEELEKINTNADPDLYNIVMTHEHFISMNDEVGDLKYSSFHTYEDLVKFDKINGFVMGHLHRGFKPTYYETKSGRKQWYINPWNIYRLARNYYVLNDEHTPEVAILDTDNDTVIHVPLLVPPTSEVFNPKILEKELEEQNTIEEMTSLLSSDGLSGVTMEEQLEGLELPKKIREVINKYVEQAKIKN